MVPYTNQIKKSNLIVNRSKLKKGYKPLFIDIPTVTEI